MSLASRKTGKIEWGDKDEHKKEGKRICISLEQ